MDISGTLKDNMKVFLPVLGLVAVILAFYMVDLNTGSLTDMTLGPSEKGQEITYEADVQTSLGSFKINLYEDIATKNVENFVSLANDGFYNDLTFHRVIDNFIIQTGDPVGDGTGNAGYYIDDEIAPGLVFREYLVAMANEGRPNTNSSQFFITLEGGSFSHLDGNYTVIGEVVEGFSVVEQIGSVDVDANDVPRVDVVVERIDIK